MAQDPLHVLWIEPSFPGRLGGVADWLVRRRGYRSWFYCHNVDAPEYWPASVGKGLDVQTFGVGGIARDSAVTWSRALERSLCYAYGCWEVLQERRPRPIDLIVGRSADLGSALFAPVYYPAAPVVNYLEYYYQPHRYDLADEAGSLAPAAYYHWRRSIVAIDLLDLEQVSLGWVPTRWQRDLYPAEYRDSFLVLHEGVDTRRFQPPGRRMTGGGPRSIAGRAVPEGMRVVTFVAGSLERLRGFDRFLTVATTLIGERSDVLCVVLGEPIVRRGLDVVSHNTDYQAQLLKERAPADPERLWFLGRVPPARVAEVLAASDLHIAPGRPYPVARSLLEAMASGCVVLASDTEPHREVLVHGQTGLLVAEQDTDGMVRQALAALDDRAAHAPLGTSAAAFIREQFARDVCLPRLAATFSDLASARGPAR
jgi:glycosyltransferase involved in cell wall biosynthesis